MDERERTLQVELAAKGDADALQRLTIEYHGSLRRLVDGQMDDVLRRHVSPEDVLQDAYAAANRSIKSCQFAGPAPFYKWFEKIVLRKLVDHQRAVGRLPAGESKIPRPRREGRDSYLGLSQLVVARGGTPTAELAHEEAVAALITSLARLPDDQRNAIRLRYLEQKSAAEVAVCMGKTESAVNGLCWRGIKKLSETMNSISRYLLQQ